MVKSWNVLNSQLQAVKDDLDLVVLDSNLESTPTLFSKRISQALKLTMEQMIDTLDQDVVKSLLKNIASLKDAQALFGLYVQIVGESDPQSVETKLAQSKYVPSDTILASFQNRGNELNELRDIVNGVSEKVIVITGMPGIGKTDFVKAFFLKLLADWSPVWISVVPGSSVARLVSEIGSRFGLFMDVDSLSTTTEKVFRHELAKIFHSLFNLQRYALVIDDLIDIRGNSRDYHHLQAIIDEATRFEKFKGSHIFIISSVSSPPLFVQRAGVARMHLRGLEEKHIRRTIEFQLRSSGMLVGETVPDIPQKFFNFVSGHPLLAKIVSEASRKTSFKDLQASLDSGEITSKAIENLMPRLEFSPDEQNVMQLLANFRLPINRKVISKFCEIKIVEKLSMKGLVDFDGFSYTVHPLLKSYFLRRTPLAASIVFHRLAISYYDSIPRKERLVDDNAILLEIIHHAALAGDMKRLSELRANSFEELLASARRLYSEREWGRALVLFFSISELRPNDPTIWASIGRCYGRRTQWSDCDDAFARALDCAKLLKLETWWMQRDWAHIRIRYHSISEGRKHLQEAKETGGKNDPSVIAQRRTWFGKKATFQKLAISLNLY